MFDLLISFTIILISLIISLVGYYEIILNWITFGGANITFTGDEQNGTLSDYSFLTEITAWPIIHYFNNMAGFLFITSFTLIYIKYPLWENRFKNIIYWSYSIFLLVTLAIVWEMIELLIKLLFLILSDLSTDLTAKKTFLSIYNWFYEPIYGIIITDMTMPFVTSFLGIILVEIGAFVPISFLLFERNTIFILLRCFMTLSLSSASFLHIFEMCYNGYKLRVGYWSDFFLQVSLYGVCYVFDRYFSINRFKTASWVNRFYLHFGLFMVIIWGCYFDFKLIGYSNKYFYTFPIVLIVGFAYFIGVILITIITNFKTNHVKEIREKLFNDKYMNKNEKNYLNIIDDIDSDDDNYNKKF